MKLAKNQVVTVVKDFKAQGKQFKAGKQYKVFMASGEKAAALMVELMKSGKEKTINNMNNVRALHEVQISEAVKGEYIKMEGK